MVVCSGGSVQWWWCAVVVVCSGSGADLTNLVVFVLVCTIVDEYFFIF